MNTLVILLLPFGLALALACGLRLGLGPERGARVAGVASVVAFLVAWGIVLRPGWFAADPVGRIGHIALGAAVVGFALDFIAAKRLWAALAAGVVVLVSCWASLNGTLWPVISFTWAKGAALIGLTAAAFLVVVRLDSMTARGLTAQITALMMCFGLAAVAAVAGDKALAATALILAMAIVGYAGAGVLMGLPASDGFVLGVGATLLAIAWAFVQRNAGVAVGLVLLPLMLFAEGTAQRVPLPKARISNFLYPLVLAGVSALPLVLAVLITLALRS